MSTPSYTPIDSLRRRGAMRRPSSVRRARGMTPLGAVARGLVAGAAGTFAMDALLYARYRRGHGEEGFEPWESSSGLETWEQAPAPAQVGKRLVEGLFERELPATARATRQQHHPLGLRDLRRRAVRDRRGLAAHTADPVRTAIRRRRVGGRLRRAAGRQAVRADLGVRPRDVDEGPERAPGLRLGPHRAAPADGRDGSGVMTATRRSHETAHGIAHRAEGAASPTTVADVMVADPEGLRRPPGIRAARGLDQRVHRRVAPRRRGRLGARASRGGGGLCGRRRGRDDRGSWPSAPRAAARGTCISSTACSTPTAAECRCSRSPRTSRAKRSGQLFPGDPSAGAVPRVQRVLPSSSASPSSCRGCWRSRCAMRSSAAAWPWSSCPGEIFLHHAGHDRPRL